MPIPLCLIFLLAFFTANVPSAELAEALPWPEPDKQKTDKLIAELREALPMETFRIARVGPWIVATDLSEAQTANFTDSTISKYAAKIQRQLFTSKPRSEPVKVYLFQNRMSYETWNKKLFGEKPSSPYGYYSRHYHALVMNIATGGGTLIHEMVHAMAEADFPDIPAWLNEGLGSLFEATSSDAEGHAVGVTNWRLAGLKAALKKGTAPKFKDLLTLTDTEFYGESRGVNYAAVRYLMQWLQEKGKLNAFYVSIRDKKNDDALAALRTVFDNKLTIEQIEEQCYKWAAELVPPEY